MRRSLDAITLVLVIVGALNWGLVGLFKFDLVALSGIYQIGCLARLLSGADEQAHEGSRLTMRG